MRRARRGCAGAWSSACSPIVQTDRDATGPLLILLRRFATESAREEARLFCDELVAEDAIAPDDLIAA